MMWIDGVSPVDVVHAYAAAVPALLVGGWIASRQQHAHAPMRAASLDRHAVDWGRLAVVATLLVAALAANIGVNAAAPELANLFPVLGVALWTAILVTAVFRRPDWSVLPAAITGVGVPAVAGAGGVDDAGRAAAELRRGPPRSASASSRRCSTTFR